MLIKVNGYANKEYGAKVRRKGPMSSMDSMDTHEFVEKVHDTQHKQELNHRHHGKGTPSDKLPNKQKSTNK